VLNPALCLHTFPLYENAQLPPGRVDAVTVTGSCFRDESGNLNNAERLNEFRMREAVFFGEPKALDRIHAELVGALIALGELLGWSFRVETASDMFFNENADRQLLSQLLSDNKLELLIDIPSVGREVACASINRHHSHFATAFGIRELEDRYAATMCVGFGLDRLLLAMVDQLDAGLADFGDRLLGRLAALQPDGVTVAAGA
jgi:seryl-tRNA synthetase